MQNPTKQSFIVNIKLMQILRWYPSKNYSKFHILQGYMLYLVFIILATSLVMVKVWVEKKYDLFQLIYICETTCYALKVLPFLGQNERIKKCSCYFDGDEFRPQDKTENEILTNCVLSCQAMTKFYLISVTCAEILYAFPALLSKGFDLPMNFWLPYSTTSSYVVYYATYFYISIACVYAGCASSLIDPLLGGLMLQAVCRLKILKHRIQIPEFLDEDNSILLPAAVHEKLVRCIEYHLMILKFVEEFQQCFSWTIFNQFLGTAATLSYVCIAIITAPSVSTHVIMYIMLFFIANWQILFYCYFGTLLYEESDTLVTAIYLSQWYDYPLKTKKILFTLMERSKRPMVLSAEKFIPLTLDTFVTVLKRSYSFVAVLK